MKGDIDEIPPRSSSGDRSRSGNEGFSGRSLEAYSNGALERRGCWKPIMKRSRIRRARHDIDALNMFKGKFNKKKASQRTPESLVPNADWTCFTRRNGYLQRIGEGRGDGDVVCYNAQHGSIYGVPGS